MKLVVAPLDAPSYLGRVGSRRSDPVTAIGAPESRYNRGFRVGRSIFDATRHAGVFVVPVAPANAMGSPSVVTGPFSAVNRGQLFRRLIPSAGAARHHPICPGPTPDPKSIAKTNRWHPQRKREIMGLMAVAATVSKDRIQPVGRLFIGLISFRSAGGIAGPGSILRPGR